MRTPAMSSSTYRRSQSAAAGYPESRLHSLISTWARVWSRTYRDRIGEWISPRALAPSIVLALRRNNSVCAFLIRFDRLVGPDLLSQSRRSLWSMARKTPSPLTSVAGNQSTGAAERAALRVPMVLGAGISTLVKD